jgi:hypothetical protein
MMSKMTRQRQHLLKQRRWIIVPASVLGASLLLAVTVWAAGPGSVQQTATSKQGQMSQMAAQATAAAQSWHAPKSSSSAPAVPTCPRGPVQSGIFTGDTGGFHEQIVNDASVAPNGGTPFAYVIYAGALRTTPQQGMLIVVRLDQDPCAPNAAGTKVTYYLTPYQRGALTVTQVRGTTLTFTAAAGGVGHFDVVNGHYL